MTGHFYTNNLRMQSDRLEFQITQLENGIQTYYHDMDVPFFQISVIVPVGATNDVLSSGLDRPGIAHLLEHMCLKRSELHPEVNSFNAIVTASGGSMNAWTHDTYTEFFLTLPTVNQSKLLVQGFLSHIFTPLLDKLNIEKEKGIIRNEAATDTFYPGENSVSKYRFTNWLPLALSSKEQMYGTPESLSLITTNDLHELHECYTTPQTKVLVGGSVNIDLIHQELSNILTKDCVLKQRCTALNIIKKGSSTIYDDVVSTPVLSWGGVSPRYTVSDYWAVNFITELFTDSDFGLLYHWIRNEKNYTYDTAGLVFTEVDRGGWLIDIPLNSEAEALELISELDAQVDNWMSDDSAINRAKEALLARHCYKYQTLTERMDVAIHSQYAFNKQLLEKDYIEWLQQVSAESLRPKFERYFSSDNTSTLIALPIEQIDK